MGTRAATRFVALFLHFCVCLGAPSKIIYTQPRRENNLNSFKYGVSLDYSFNETEAYIGEPISSPGCPESYEGRPWVYYGKPIKCYLTGFPGPCPHGQRIFFVATSKYGVCNCDCFATEAKVARPPILTVPRPVNDLIDYTLNDISNNLILRPRYLEEQSSSHRNRRSANFQGPFVMQFPYFIWNNNNNNRRPCNTSTAPRVRKPTTIEFQSPRPTPKPSEDVEDVEIGVRLFSISNKDRYKFCFSEWHRREVVYDSVRQKCTPFLDQGPCNKGKWLIRNLDKSSGVTCEKRKCPEVNGLNVQPDFGGSFSFFDYKHQTCRTEVYGNLLESVFTAVGSILTGGNSNFCRNAGMKYSHTLRTCVKDISKEFQYNAGIG